MSGQESLCFFREFYCAWMMVVLAGQFRSHLRWVRIRGATRVMPSLLNCVSIPHLRPLGFAVSAVVLIALLCLGLREEWASGWALTVAGAGAALYCSQVIELPTVRRKANTVPVILLLLGLAGLSVKKPGAEQVARLCLLAIKILVSQIYFSSGLTKIRQSGWRWINSSTLQLFLLRYHLRDDSSLALRIARQGVACRVVAGLVLFFELTFWLVIPFPELVWIYLPAGLVFHLGTAIIMKIHYWIYVLPAYVAFIISR